MWISFTIPIIHAYSLKTQLIILSILLIISYLHRKSRFLIAFLISAYFLFKISVPLIRWSWVFFKAMAWFGFYVHYFQSAFGFIVGAAAVLWSGAVEWMERVSREREAEKERERETEWQRQREAEWNREREREREAEREREERRRGADGAGNGAPGGKKGKKNRR